MTTEEIRIQTAVEIEIPFHDVDMLNIVWHGHYCKYLEIARCALLKKINYDYMTMLSTGYVWPIIDVHLRFVQPARFLQRIHITAELVEHEYRMKIKYKISDATDGQILAKAHTIQVAVNTASGEMCYASPDIFLTRLAAYSNAS